MTTTDRNRTWPELDVATLAPTMRSLHLYAQMLGKLRLALSPHQPNFVFTALALAPRGFTTGSIPFGDRAFEASVDVFAAELVVETSDGAVQRIPLAEPRTVAAVFAALHRALAGLGIAVSLSPIPQEVADVTPLDTDERPAAFDLVAAQRWHAAAIAIGATFDRWRAHFGGRNGIYLWWGAFDLALVLFNGRRVPAPTDRGYLLKYDLDAEMMNVGFYPGDGTAAPFFYGYIIPQPASCAALPIAPAEAAWSETAGEWILPYDAVRGSADPAGALTAFLDAVYRTCGSASGWDAEALTYVPPPLRRAKEPSPPAGS